MADWLHAISDVLPLSYAVDAMNRITTQSGFSGALAADLGVVLGCTLLALALGAATLRRRTA
jgi:ABC-2 type transport system permease protein